MTGANPDAAFDTLSIGSALTRAYGPASLPEIQAVAYLACLLSVYDGRPSSEWGYEFAATDSTSPFSVAVLDATERLRAAGLLRQMDGRFASSPEGDDVLLRWAAMHRFGHRQRYLQGATGAADALPLPALSSGLRREPQIATAVSVGSPRPLLDELGRMALHRYFQTLEEALGAGVDLLVPAVVWLTYLLNQDDVETDRLAVGGAGK